MAINSSDEGNHPLHVHVRLPNRDHHHACAYGCMCVRACVRACGWVGVGVIVGGGGGVGGSG